MNLHSSFLIHWTDREFLKIKDVDERRNEYVKRLRDTCKHGLYMKEERGEEEEKKKIWGVQDKWIYPNIVRVCFSEIRLSQAACHADRYGELGIGVHRSFILEREGNPVFYVQNGKKGHVVEQFAVIHAYAEHLARALEQARTTEPVVQALEAADIHPAKVRDSIRDPLRFLMGYAKNMSDRDSSELTYYDEMEWRVVHVDRLVGKYIFPDKDTRGVYRLRLSPQDVRIIVFRDGETRDQAQEDEFLRRCFKGNWPMMTTLEECGSF